MNKNIRGVATAVALALASAWTSAQESPAAPVERFEIKAQSLSSALRVFADQTGEQVVFFSEIGKGLQAAEVVGNYTREQALQRLLNRTGLTFERLNQKTIAITDAKSKSESNSLVNKTSFDVGPIRLAQVSGAEQTENTESTSPSKGEGQSENSGEQQASVKKPVDEVVVTGSHIRGDTSPGSQITVIGRQEIEKSGFATVQDLLRTLPQNFPGGISEFDSTDTSALNLNGGTALNLRGLGANSTLVLVNGRRQPAGGLNGAFVDVSSIAASAIERIEVLTDGASAVYGSDAIGGVINFILRSDYEGAETRVRLGTLNGDASEDQISQSLGFKWDGGNAIVGYQYYERDSLQRRARAYTASDNLAPFGGTDFRSINSNPGNILDPRTFRPAYAIPEGQGGISLTPDDLLSDVTNYHDSGKYADLLAWQQMHSGFVSASHQVTERAEVYVDARYGARKTNMHGMGDTETLVVPSTNPYFVSPFGGSTSVRVAYNFIDDLGPLLTKSKTYTTAATLGTVINLTPSWRVDIAGVYGNERAKYNATNMVNSRALNAALSDLNPETAFNPFGSGLNNNPSTIAAIRASQKNDARAGLLSANLIADGVVMDLPSGDIKLALGAEHRREDLLSSLDATDFERLANDTGRTVTAAFAELSIPLIGEQSPVRNAMRLDVSVAVRYEDYSDFGSTTNPKLGFDWTLTDWVDLPPASVPRIGS